MKTKIIPLVIMLSLVGCSPVVKKTPATPSLDIQITDAFAGETNAYLKGSVIFSGLHNIDFDQNQYGIRFRYFYVEDEDGLPLTDQVEDEWGSAPRVNGTYTKELNEMYPVKIDTRKRSNIMILASVCDSGRTNEICRVWCKKKIHWKQ